MSNRHQPRHDDQEIRVPSFNDIWIREGIRSEAISYAELLGKKLVQERFTTSQIRNFYGELKQWFTKNLRRPCGVMI